MKILKDAQLSWVNVDNPSADDIAWLQKEFGLHPLVIKELTVSMHHPKMDVFGNYIFLAFQIPVEKDGGGNTLRIEELDLIIGKDWLISSHTSHLPFVGEFFAKCMASQETRKEYFEAGPAAVIQGLIAGLYENINSKLDNIEGQIAFIEEEIFKGREQNIVLVISQIRREIIDFMRTLEPMQTLFKDLMTAGQSLLGKDARPYLEYVSESHAKLINILLTQRETITALEQTNYSLLSTKTNENIRLLAVYATLLLIPSIIPGLFGMNLAGIPFSQSPHGFSFITIVVVIITVITFFFFKFKRWV